MLLTALTEWKRQLKTQWRQPLNRRRRRRPSRESASVERLEYRTLLSTINGVVFSDLDGNQNQDTGETGLAGVTVYLDLNDNGQFDQAPAGIEPDNYASGTDVSSIYPGVTLRATFRGDTPTPVVAVSSPNVSSTGVNVFGPQGVFPTWSDAGWSLEIEFDQAVSFVSIDAIGAGGSNAALLSVFDANGNRLDQDRAIDLTPGGSATLSSTANGIRRAVVSGVSSDLVGLDNLRFGNQEPSAISDSNGEYTFSNLAAGDYVVRQVVPDGFEQTTPTGSAQLFAYKPSVNPNVIVELDLTDGHTIREIPSPASQFPSTFQGLAFDGTTLYFLSNGENILYELDPDTGAVLDQTLLPSQTPSGNAPHRYDGLTSLNGMVYVFEDNTDALLVFDPTTNQIVFTVDITPPDRTRVTFDNSLGSLTGPDVILIGAQVPSNTNDVEDDSIYLLDPTTGTILSSFQHTGGIDGGLAGVGSEIFVGISSDPQARIEVYDRDGNLKRTLDGSTGFDTNIPLFGLAGGGATGDGHSVTLAAGQVVSGLDFGNRSQGGEIRGMKWEDRDGDGNHDSGEPGLGGVTVYLDLNQNGVFDFGGAAEPDDFPPGTELTDAFEGVTLTTAGSTNQTNSFFKVRSNTDSASSTGTQVFFQEGNAFWTSSFRFRADFDQPVAEVHLDFISSSPFGQTGTLLAFDAAGNQIGSYTTSSLSSGLSETMTITHPTTDIAYITAYTLSGSFGRLDNFQFGNPEPFALTDVNGEYVFADLAAGTYTVREVVEDGFQQTSPGAQGDFYYALNSQSVIRVDAATGTVTQIGPHNAGTALNGLTYTNSGELFAISGDGTDRFWRLDPATGQATLIGDTGREVGFGLAYDKATDTIYGVGQHADGSVGLLIYDRLTGVATPVGTGVTTLVFTSGVAFDDVNNRIIAFDNGDDEFYAFTPDGVPSLLATASPAIQSFGLTFNGTDFILSRSFDGFQRNLVAIDPDTGASSVVLTLSQAYVPEGLEFVEAEPFAHVVSLAPGQVITGRDFGNQMSRGELRGTKFEDLDGDGVRDAGESGLEGITIYLDANNNGNLDEGEVTTTTDADGDYVFSDIQSGEYVVREVVPEGYVQSSPGAQDDFYYATTRGSRELLKIDVQTGQVTHIGPHLAGTDLQGMVATNSGELFAISGTGSNDGFWSIDPLTGQATRIGSTGTEVGFGLAYDSATDTIYGIARLLDQTNGLVTYDRTTGQFQPISTSGISSLTGTSGVAFDPDQNRILVYNYSSGGIYSFTPDGTGQLLSQSQAFLGVNLSYVDGELVMARFPNSLGTQFIGINPDTGAIRNLDRLPEQFTAESLDFVDVEPFAHLVTLGPGQSLSGLDFANQPDIGTLRGVKFEDLDGDGVRDAGEPGLEGVTIYLDLNDNGGLDIGGVAEPDNFANGTELTNAFAGVTLSVAGSNNQTNSFFKVRSNTDSLASTGTQTFFEEGIPFWSSGFRFRADFDETISQVSLDFISSGSGQIGTLLAFDADGNLLESYTTSNLARGEVETMTISRTASDIDHIVAYTVSGSFGRLDNFVFGTPEPSVLTDANGEYAFADIASGSYIVREIVPEGYRQTSPIPAAGRLFANDTNASPDRIVELDPTDGSVINQFNAPTTFGSIFNGLAFDGNVLYFLSDSDETLYELNPANGSILDSFQLPSGNYSGVAVLNGLVYAMDTLQDDVLILDPNTNTVVGELDVNGSNSGVLLNDGLGELGATGELIVMESSEVHLIDPTTGVVNSSFNLVSGFGPRGVTSVDGEIYIGFTLGIIDVYSPDGVLLRSITNTTQAYGLGGSDSVLDDGHRVTLAPGEILTGLDFGNQSIFADIYGEKFEDLDGDGVRDAGEPGLEGVTIYLDLNDNGVLDTGGLAEPDDFPDRTDVRTAFEGVTLSVLNSFNDPLPFPVTSNIDSNASTGDQVFGHANISFFNTNRRLRMNFDTPVRQIAIDFAGGASLGTEVGRLEIYDADGNLLDTYVTDPLGGGEVETMSLLRPTAEIAYAIAYTAAGQGSFGRLDQLVFGETPEPFRVTDANGAYAFLDIDPGDYVVREVVPFGYQQTAPFGTPPRLFATDTFASPDRIVELNLTDGSEIDSFTPPDRDLSIFNGLAFDGRVLYQVNDTNNTLYELDPDTGAVLDSTVLPAGGYDGLATLNGLVYAMKNAANQIVVFDPSTNTVVDTLTITGVPPAYVYDGFGAITGPDALLARTLFNELIFIDPTSGVATVGFDLASGASTRAITSVNGEIYVGTTDRTIDVYDREGNRLRTWTTSFGVFALAGAEGIFDDAYRVSLESGEFASGLDFGNLYVNQTPIADAGGPYTINEGDSLTLDGSGSSDPDGHPLTYAWDLDGDGEFDDATGVSPTLTWAELFALGIDNDGTYPIRLQVSDTLETDTADSSLVVSNVAPEITALILDANTIDENGTVQLVGTFTDPGTADTHDVVIDWGDGSEPTTIHLTGGERTFTVEHTYLDDDPSGTARDDYSIRVRVTDSDSDHAEDSINVTVQNMAPVVNPLVLSETTISENGAVTVTGSFTDQGTLDTHTVSIQWGDGTTSPATVDQAAGTFTATHTYRDEDPSGTAADPYTIRAIVTDDDTGASEVSATLIVENRDPVITSLTTTAATVGSKAPGDVVELSGAFTDPGTLDTHSATIFWGDGTSSSATIDQGSGEGTLSSFHVYATGGFFEIRVVLTDDDTGEDSQSVVAFITGARIADGVLQIVGTAEADEISVNAQGNGTIKVHGRFLNAKGHQVTLPNDDLQYIGVFLGDGDDQFSLAGNIDTPLFVVAGAGEDHINAARGASLLIGGTGPDELQGGSGADILIGGTTDFDQNPLALQGLLAEWASTTPLANRVANLFDGSGSGGLNGNVFLTVGEEGTIRDDQEADNLIGGPGMDWFFFEPGQDEADDLRDEIFANDLDLILMP